MRHRPAIFVPLRSGPTLALSSPTQLPLTSLRLSVLATLRSPDP